MNTCGQFKTGSFWLQTRLLQSTISLCNLPKTMELYEKLYEMPLMNTSPARLMLYFQHTLLIPLNIHLKTETTYIEYLKEVRITESQSGLGWKGPPVGSSRPTFLLKQSLQYLTEGAQFLRNLT